LCGDPARCRLLGTPAWLALRRFGVDTHYRNRFATRETLARAGSRCAETQTAVGRENG